MDGAALIVGAVNGIGASFAPLHPTGP